MKDRRQVDGLSIEELERVLLVKKREERLARLRQMRPSERVVGRDPLDLDSPPPAQPPLPSAHRQFQDVGALDDYRSVEVEDERPGSWWGRLARWLAAPLHVNWRFVFNKILLLIEIAAVVAVIVVTVGLWQDRTEINEEAAEIFTPPTPTAAPLINVVVLPGGHTPPNAQGVSYPEPIPEHLQALVQSITPQPVPTRGPEHATRIVIPAIDVNHPVVEGDDDETLKRGVGHTPWSANPGEAGNSIMSAHNDIFGEIFRYLNDLELGDEILVHTSTQVYRYVVKAKRIIEPTEVEVMYPTNHPVLTLISCYPYLVDNRRVVVIAELEQ
jgi:sortase A